MKFHPIPASLLALLVINAQALQLEKRDSPSVLSLTFDKKNDDGASGFQKRAQPIALTTNPRTTVRYYVNYTLGTPPQQLYAAIDSGSGNLIVHGPKLKGCSLSSCIGGIYDSTKSSTAKDLNVSFSYSYTGGMSYQGDVFTDDIAFGGAKVPSFEFVSMHQWSAPGSGSFDSLLGLGFPAVEGSFQTTPYPNLPVALKSAGAINTAAYSMYLNGPGGRQGQLLFGGVNRAKYTGPLMTYQVPVNPDVQKVDQFLAGITNLSVSLNGGQSTALDFTPQYGVLDSGAPFLDLPGHAVTSLLAAIGGKHDSAKGVYIAPCSVGDGNASLDFSLGPQLTIKVPLSDLVVPPHIYFANDVSLVAGGVDQCVVTVNGGSAKMTLGDTFLRSAYVVFDVDNAQISLAQANFNATNDDILEIVANTTVPGATTVAAGSLPSIAPFDALQATPATASEITATATTTTHFSTTAPSAAASKSGGDGGTKKGDASTLMPRGEFTLSSVFAALLGSIFLA